MNREIDSSSSDRANERLGLRNVLQDVHEQDEIKELLGSTEILTRELYPRKLNLCLRDGPRGRVEAAGPAYFHANTPRFIGERPNYSTNATADVSYRDAL